MRFLELIRTTWGDLNQKTRLWAGYAMITLLVAALGWSALAGRVAGLEKKRNAREGVLKELLTLKVDYRNARQSSDRLIGRMALLRPDDSPAKIMEEIGIKGKGIKIAPLKGEARGAVTEEVSDVRVEGLTFNEAVNLVYRLEKGTLPLVIKKLNIRTRFDDPSRCDLSMILALLKPAPGQAK